MLATKSALMSMNSKGTICCQPQSLWVSSSSLGVESLLFAAAEAISLKTDLGDIRVTVADCSMILSSILSMPRSV